MYRYNTVHTALRSNCSEILVYRLTGNKNRQFDVALEYIHEILYAKSYILDVQFRNFYKPPGSI